MRELFILIAHLLVTLAKLGTRGGLAAVAAESLAVKHQRRGYRDEAAESPLGLPQDCRANIESIRCRDQ